MTDSSTIVITGFGLATCLGNDADTTWQRILQNDSGMAPMSAMESSLPANKDGGQCPVLPAAYHATLPREARYLRWTIEAAMRHAGLDVSAAPNARIALVLGTTLHGMRAGGAFLRSQDPRQLATFLAGDTARLATEGLCIGGLSVTTCSACSSSLGAVALATTLLQRGEADIVLAGGYDTISEYVWAGFNALRLISDPPLRPFTRGRCGMKVAEGYGIAVLERMTDAQSRGIAPIARVAGWGESADAFHLTRPHPQGEGAVAAMRSAIERAGIAPGQIDLIAAHATGTPENDSSEAAAITSLLGEHASSTPVVGFKSHLGHTLGGAGAVELILSALAMRDQTLPPSANIVEGEIEYPAIRLATAAVQHPIAHTLNTSLGFGGANTCIVLARPATAVASIKVASETPALITGIGALVPGAIGNEAFLKLSSATSFANDSSCRDITDAEIEHLINARRIRRMSQYVKLSLAAAAIASNDAGVASDADWLRRASAILATTHASTSYSYDYYEQIVREGVLAANPMLFAEGVPNAAAAQLSLMFGLQGACQTIIGTASAGADALRLAASRIASGAVDRVIVVAAEEPHWTLDAAYATCPSDEHSPPIQSCAAGVAFIVESPTSASTRSAAHYGRIGSSRSFSGGSGPIERTLRHVLSTDGGDARPTLFRPNIDPLGRMFSASPLLALAEHLLRRTNEAALLIGLDRTHTATTMRIEPPVSA